MNNFGFWHKWLLVVGLYLTIFGIILALIPHSFLMNLFINNHVDQIFWADGILPDAANSFQGWVYGVLGATVAGWGVMMSLIIYFPFKRGERWSWYCLVLCFGLWYVIDTSLSLYYGVPFNALFNTTLLLLVAIPLGFTHRYFRR